MSIYTDNGYESREDYLNSLADEYGVDVRYVKDFACILGEDEDFDGLVIMVADLSSSNLSSEE